MWFRALVPFALICLVVSVTSGCIAPGSQSTERQDPFVGAPTVSGKIGFRRSASGSLEVSVGGGGAHKEKVVIEPDAKNGDLPLESVTFWIGDQQPGAGRGLRSLGYPEVPNGGSTISVSNKRSVFDWNSNDVIIELHVTTAASSNPFAERWHYPLRYEHTIPDGRGMNDGWSYLVLDSPSPPSSK